MTERLAIVVAKVPGTDQWVRIVDENGLSLVSKKITDESLPDDHWRQMYMNKYPPQPPRCFNLINGIWIRDLRTLRRNNKVRILSRVSTDIDNYVYLCSGKIGTAGVVSVELLEGQKPSWADIYWIKVGFDTECRPIVLVANEPREKENWRYLPTSLLFSRARLHGRGSSFHSRLFSNYWLRDADGECPDGKDAWKAGMFVWDPWDPEDDPAEHDTVCCDLDDINIRLRLSLLPAKRKACAHTTGPSQAEYFIWTLDVIGLEGRSPEQTFWIRRAQRYQPSRSTAAFLALVGGRVAYNWRRNRKESTKSDWNNLIF